jgi:hypothetical protein
MSGAVPLLLFDARPPAIFAFTFGNKKCRLQHQNSVPVFRRNGKESITPKVNAQG